MTPEMIGIALVLVGVLLLIGKFLRLRWSWKAAQRLFLPSSLLAGFVALLVGPGLLGRLTGDEGPFAEGLFPAEVLEVWEALPELLITVVFATLFLGHRIPPLGQVWRYGGPQLSLEPNREGLDTSRLSERVMNTLSGVAGPTPELRRVEFVGPQVGKELAADGAMALLRAIQKPRRPAAA